MLGLLLGLLGEGLSGGDVLLCCLLDLLHQRLGLGHLQSGQARPHRPPPAHREASGGTEGHRGQARTPTSSATSARFTWAACISAWAASRAVWASWRTKKSQLGACEME